MKILARIAAILAAALVVVGATVALSNAGALNGLLNAGRFEGVRAVAQRADAAPGEFARGEGRRQQFDRAFEQGRPGAGRPLNFEGNFERGRFGGFSLFGAFELARNLAIVLLIVAAAVVLTLIWRRLKRLRSRDAGA